MCAKQFYSSYTKLILLNDLEIGNTGQAFLDTLCSLPVSLYNTIKSGIAVDYPLNRQASTMSVYNPTGSL